jgi:hypothetical protein
MNQGGYFGAYQSGFQTLPKGAYEMMTAPTKQNAETITKAASSIGSMVQKYADQQAADQAFQQGSAAQFENLKSISQATGVPMNPELANQYMNIGQMSPQQQAVFNQSMAQEAQRYQTLYGINQRQAQAQQAQGMQQVGSQVDYMIAGRNQPRVSTSNAGIPALPTVQGGMPSVPVYGGAYDNLGSMMPRVGTINKAY